MQRDPWSTAKLGRVGQQCDPLRIANVIGRFLLRPALLEIGRQPCATKGCMRGICIARQSFHHRSQDTRSRIGRPGRRRGLWSSLDFGEQPCQVTGSRYLRLSECLTLYLDETTRITQTYQGSYAVNLRDDEGSNPCLVTKLIACYSSLAN